MRLAGSGVSMRDSRSFAAGLALGMGLVMPEWMRGYLASKSAGMSVHRCIWPSATAAMDMHRAEKPESHTAKGCGAWSDNEEGTARQADGGSTSQGGLLTGDASAPLGVMCG